MSAASKRHMGRVAELPCCICGAHGVHVHHVREGVGMGQRQSDWLTIPVCPSCHTGPKGIHGDKTMLRIYKKDELDLLAETIERLYA
jgi:hypothetical protein